MATRLNRQVIKLGVPKPELAEKYLAMLASYRGAVAIRLVFEPKVVILARAAASYFVRKTKCLVMLLDVGLDVEMELHFYPRSPNSSHSIMGIEKVFRGTAINDPEDDYPATVYLLK